MIIKTLELETPLEWGDEKITRLEFKSLKARHLASMSAKPTFKDFLQLVAQSTNLNISQINELELSDAVRAVEIVSGFFPSGQETGEAS